MKLPLESWQKLTLSYPTSLARHRGGCHLPFRTR
jgi:hypothetical protein